MGMMAGVYDLTLDYILGKVFIPVAYVIGIPSDDAEQVARLIGTKIIINEFAAFQDLGIFLI